MTPAVLRQKDISYWLNRQPITSAATASLPFLSTLELDGGATPVESTTTHGPQQTRLKYWVEHRSAKSPSPAFSFLDFPKEEIRDEIYNHLYPIKPPPFQHKDEVTTVLGENGEWLWLYDWPSVSFLLTCRTIYLEAIPFFYGHQRFYFELPTYSHRDVVYDWVRFNSPLVWLNKIGPRNCSYIRHISVMLGTGDDVDTNHTIETGYTIYMHGSSDKVNLLWLATEVVLRLFKRLPCLESLSLEFRAYCNPISPPVAVLSAIETIPKLKHFYASVMLHELAKDSPIVEVLRRRPVLRNPHLWGIMGGRITALYVDGAGSLELYDGVAYSLPREQRVSKFWQDVAPMQELEIWDYRATEHITPLEIRAIQVSQQASLEKLVLLISTGGISLELGQALKGCARSMEKLKSFSLLPCPSWNNDEDRILPWHVDSSLLTCLPPSIERLLLALRVSNRALCESHCATLVFRCKRLKYFRYTNCNLRGGFRDLTPLRLSMPRLVRAGVDAEAYDSVYDGSYARELSSSDTWCY